VDNTSLRARLPTVEKTGLRGPLLLLGLLVAIAVAVPLLVSGSGSSRPQQSVQAFNLCLRRVPYLTVVGKSVVDGAPELIRDQYRGVVATLRIFATDRQAQHARMSGFGFRTERYVLSGTARAGQPDAAAVQACATLVPASA
jgi:hypothetical protein